MNYEDQRRTQVAKTTQEFNMIWENDYDVYHAVLREARDMLARVPGMTPQTIGRNVKDRVFSWAYGGGWGYSDGWGGTLGSLRDEDRYPSWQEGPPPAGYRANPFSYFLDRDTYSYVSEELVGENVLDALAVELPKEDA